MARNRSAPRRRLTFEQQAVMSSMGMLLCSEEGESNLDTVVRLFGGAETARAAWYGHREAALAADPVAGRRPPLWWLFERGMDPPRVGEEEEALLRELGFLTPDEESQLEQWRRMVPEKPADLALDHQSTTEGRVPLVAILEEPDHAIDAPSEPTRPEIAEAGGGNDAPASCDRQRTDPPRTGRADGSGGAHTAEEGEQAAEGVVSPPRILPMHRYGPDDRRPAEVEGWE